MMNAVERFAAVLDGQKPDRMPLYIPAMACSVASEILGCPAHTGGDSLHFKEEFSWTLGEQAHDEFVAKYREDIFALSKALDVDVVRDAWRCKRKPAKRLDDNTLLFGDENGAYSVKRYFPETQSYGTVESTEGCRDVDALKREMEARLQHNWRPTDEDLARTHEDHVEILRLAGGRYAVLAGALSIHLPMSDAVWLEATALEPELLRDYYVHIAGELAPQVAWFRRQGVRFLNAGSDIASKDGPVISPRSFSFFVEPALRVLAQECQRQSMTYCYRSDGNLWSLCDSIFQRAGVQAYGEVDRDASMTVGSLREKYPNVVILGNVSSITLSSGDER